ncbi:MAG: serine/threonine-protein kinase, partial [Gemmataceae bacterium]
MKPSSGAEPQPTIATSESSGMLVIPADFFPEYAGLEPIAEGGMGVVYKAFHKTLGRYEAVKLVKAGHFAGARDLDRFRFEAEATAALDHPNIVSVFRVGECRGLPFFAMEWVDGGNLTGLAPKLRANPRQCARVIAKVAKALQHAHTRGILHRDLKPANILVDSRGEPHVSDFGLAKALGQTDAGSGFTATGQAIGTPSYMAPEQARGEKTITTAVDIYGIGTVL